MREIGLYDVVAHLNDLVETLRSAQIGLDEHVDHIALVEHLAHVIQTQLLELGQIHEIGHADDLDQKRGPTTRRFDVARVQVQQYLHMDNVCFITLIILNDN